MSNSAVDYCKDHGLTVELSAEDASRTSIDFLKTVYVNAIEHGADRVLSLIHISEPTRPY